MYSGFITPHRSVNRLGAHQKLNRIAYRLMLPHIIPKNFPTLDDILHFEGYNGPDGLKVKSLDASGPMHFYDPINEEGPILEHLEHHYRGLVTALAANDRVRAAFEASWLAHSIADGLTPAHHFPYQHQREELKQKDKRATVAKLRHKVVLKGDNKRGTIRQNWLMFGKKGLLSTHIHFEMGVAAAVVAGRFNVPINQVSWQRAHRLNPIDFFKSQAKDIAHLKLYEQFYKSSWTAPLARMVKRTLIPTIADTIAVIWLKAYEEAKLPPAKV